MLRVEEVSDNPDVVRVRVGLFRVYQFTYYLIGSRRVEGNEVVERVFGSDGSEYERRSTIQQALDRRHGVLGDPAEQAAADASTMRLLRGGRLDLYRGRVPPVTAQRMSTPRATSTNESFDFP